MIKKDLEIVMCFLMIPISSISIVLIFMFFEWYIK